MLLCCKNISLGVPWVLYVGNKMPPEVFSWLHVPSTNMEEGGFMSDTQASQYSDMLWPHWHNMVIDTQFIQSSPSILWNVFGPYSNTSQFNNIRRHQSLWQHTVCSYYSIITSNNDHCLAATLTWPGKEKNDSEALRYYHTLIWTHFTKSCCLELSLEHCSGSFKEI